MNAFEAPRAVEGIDDNFDAFELAPLTPVIGAEVRNFRLAQVDESAANQLRQALWRYGVLFLKDQHLSHAELVEAGKLFGTELEHHTFGKTLADEGYLRFWSSSSLSQTVLKRPQISGTTTSRGVSTLISCPYCRPPRCPLALIPCGLARRPHLSGYLPLSDYF